MQYTPADTTPDPPRSACAERQTEGRGRTCSNPATTRRGQAIADRGPFFLFARGLSYHQSKRYAEAAGQFERAAKAKPDSPVILAWLTRAYMAAGERQKGLDAFADMRKLAPQSRLVRDLGEQFPELQ